MARTRQTARKSVGGLAPRKQLATKAVGTPSSSISQTTQVKIFKKTGRRTITAEGTAEFCVVPDSIALSFLVKETGASLNASLAAVVAKITEIRKLAAACNVPNENVCSDSIGSSLRTVEYRTYHDGNNDSNDEDGSWVYVKRGHPSKQYKVDGFKTIHIAKSVVRLYLEGPTAAEQFSKVSLSLFSAGFTCHEAPIYESTTITEDRNTARTEACENAQLKASSIVKALGESSTVVLGPPISITDVHCDTQDDAANSFLGNPGAMRNEVVNGTMPVEEEEQPADAGNIDDIASDIFLVPPLRIVASVLVIFELQSTSMLSRLLNWSYGTS